MKSKTPSAPNQKPKRNRNRLLKQVLLLLIVAIFILGTILPTIIGAETVNSPTTPQPTIATPPTTSIPTEPPVEGVVIDLDETYTTPTTPVTDPKESVPPATEEVPEDTSNVIRPPDGYVPSNSDLVGLTTAELLVTLQKEGFIKGLRKETYMEVVNSFKSKGDIKSAMKYAELVLAKAYRSSGLSASDIAFLADLYERGRDTKIKVFVNGNRLQFDAPPFVTYGTTFVPIRAVSESLKAKVDWNARTNEIVISKPILGKTKKVVLKVGSKTAIVDGKKVPLQKAPVMKSDRTFIPLRFIGETLGAPVEWNAQGSMVLIDDFTQYSPDEFAVRVMGSSN